jgi:hypothetical protein
VLSARASRSACVRLYCLLLFLTLHSLLLCCSGTKIASTVRPIPTKLILQTFLQVYGDGIITILDI